MLTLVQLGPRFTGSALSGFALVTSFYVFQVMIQKHNRHLSISLYISALAVTDTIALLTGKCESWLAHCLLLFVLKMNYSALAIKI